MSDMLFEEVPIDTDEPLEEMPPVEDGAPDEPESPPNLAKKTKLVEHTAQWVSAKYQRYIGQPERERLEDNLDLADKMLRMSQSKNNPEFEDQKSSTISNFISTGYRRRVDTITAGETGLLFDGDDPPAKFEPRPTSDDDPQPILSQDMTDQANLLEIYTFEKDDRQNKLSELHYFTNGLSNYFIEMGWEKKVQRVKEKRRDPETGELAWSESEKVVKECPSLKLWSPEKVVCDAYIPDLQDQVCIVTEDEVSWETLREHDRDGYYMNVDNITALMKKAGGGPGDSEEVNQDRQENAGADSGEESDGVFRRLTCHIKVSVKSDQRKKEGKSYLSLCDTKNPVRYYKVVFIGNDFEKYK